MATYGTWSKGLTYGQLCGLLSKLLGLLCDILEVELAIITKDEGSEGDQELGERRMHIHKVLRLDILAGELSKVYFIEATRESVSTDTSTNMIEAYTTLLGLDNRNKRTANATSTIPMSSLISPDEISMPPEGLTRLLGA
jgi:hypothetical protein